MIHTNVETFTTQGYVTPFQPNHYNEDTAFAGCDTFAVVDGATAVQNVDMNGWNSSAYTARWLQSWLMRRSAALGNTQPKDDQTALDVLKMANGEFRTHLRVQWPEVYALGKDGPCASVVVVKLHEDGTYTWAQLGDCMLVENAGGEHPVLMGIDRHCAVDNLLMEKIGEIASTRGISLNDARKLPEAMDIVREHRQWSNVKVGVFNGEPQAEKLMESGKRPLESVQNLVLMSDGMEWPLGKEEAPDFGYTHSAARMVVNGIKPYWDGLKDLLDRDPDALIYPRFKHMDDATGVVLRF